MSVYTETMTVPAAHHPSEVITLSPSPWEQAARKADGGQVVHLADDTGEHRYVIMTEEQYLAIEEALEALEDAEDIEAIRQAKAESGGERIPWEQVEAELDELNRQGR